MSNRDSLGFGDLLPQDVVDIFAQEKISKKGRKQRSRSLGRALGWLKGKKKKNVGSKGQNPGLGPAFDLALDVHPAGYQGVPKGVHRSGKQGNQQSNSHAVQKRDDSDENTPAPIVLQENVFIEVSRPKYLEDLHSEALEGLKLMQQEERIIGPEYQDNASTISTVSVRAEVDGGGFTTDSTLPDTSSTVSVQSSVSSRSSRSGLTRQGSTFRPLNSGKKSDKGRTRRRHRKTIAGIPQHLQREFGLDRAEWTASPQMEEFVNGDSDVPQLAVHSPPDANMTEVIHPLSSVQEEQISAAQTHVDDLALLQRLGPTQTEGDRPWSLAVPGMTTARSGSPGPPSPVMTMSPQAAYLSKIIPNAVLPPSIDVVEISRGSSRNSVRTVSKSSLVLSSPTSSRASSRASTARSTSSRSSTITSASQHNHFHLSDSSCWSNSDSDTLVSDSSTISSSSTPHQREAQDKPSKKQNKVSVHIDSPKYPFNGKIIKGSESKKDGPFVRSLSVMKPKRAPPPPSRSYSLHNKMKRRSRDLADVKIITSQTSEGNMKKIDSPGYNADTSSLDESTGSKTPSPLKYQQNVDSTQDNVSTEATNAKKETLQVSNYSKVISPSSGYSSQDTTSPKIPSPKHKKGLLAKLHKLFPAAASADLPANAVSQPEASKTSNAPVSIFSDKPSVKNLRELFTIPPHPKVHAPPPPPPEVWSHSSRSIELLLGPPAPGNTYAIVKKNPKDKRPYRQPASTSTEGTVRGEEKVHSNGITVESKKVHVSQEGSSNVANRTNDCERLIQTNIDVKEHGKEQVSEILSNVLVRTVDRDKDRLPAIAEEHKTITQNTKNPSISSVHISPRLPIKQTAPITSLQRVASPESSWPPPPPPVSQAGLGSPDETDLPLPPPPMFTEAEIVLPVQVPPDKPVPSESNASTSLQGTTAPPLNIPPPPPYTAPLPPVKTFSEKVKVFSPQAKDVSPPPSKITLSPPKEVVMPPKISIKSSPLTPPKEISIVATEIVPSTPAQSTNDSTAPAQTLSAIPPPPKTPPPPPQKLLLDIVHSKIIHESPTKPILLPSNSEVPPPPDLIPPTPSKEVVVVPSLVADIPIVSPSQISTQLHKEVPPPAEEVISEPAEASSPQLLVTNLNCPPGSDIITEVSFTPPKDIPPPPPTVPKPQAKASPSEPLEVLSSIKASPSPPEVAPPQAEDVLSPPVETVLISPKVTNSSPEEVLTPPQIEVTQPPVEISASLTLSIPQPEVVSQPSVKQEEAPPPFEKIVRPILTHQSPVEEHSEAPPPQEEVSIPASLPIVLLSSPLEVGPTLSEESHPSPKEVSSPEIVVVETAHPEVIEDLPPEEVPIPSPKVSLPIEVLSPSPEVTLALQEQNPPSPKETSSPEVVVIETVHTRVISDSPPSVIDERFLPIVVEVSYPQLSEETSTDAVEEDDPQNLSEKKEQSHSEDAPSVTLPSNDSSPKSEVPVPQKEKEILNETDSTQSSWKSILTPPQSIPPPPPVEQPTSDALPSNEPNKPEEITSQAEGPPPTESTSAQEAETILEPSSSMEEVPKQKPASDSAEQQSEESVDAFNAKEVSQNADPTTDQAPNGSAKPPKTENEAEQKDEEETTSQVQTTATTEVPQKPIRRSLVISSPPSPPAAVTTQLTPPKSPSPNTSPPTKSPPAMTPSMNLQEAIRLRTAARSRNGPSSRLGIHSPPGFDVRKSPTSTASFIFSKSSKKVVIETRSEAKKTEGAVTKASPEQAMKKEFKVPPPVAKKPKTKTKDEEHTAGQDIQSDSFKDGTKKSNGTARTIEGH